jgi:hypothetical protein
MRRPLSAVLRYSVVRAVRAGRGGVPLPLATVSQWRGLLTGIGGAAAAPPPDNKGFGGIG